MTARKYLITGGAGFIGSALARRLVRDGFGVRVIDDGSRATVEGLAPVRADIDYVSASVTDAAAVREAARGVDGVFHLAAINGTRRFYDIPETVLDVGVRGIVNVIDACRAEGVGELHVASTSEVYQTPAIVPTAEDAPLVIPDVTNPRYSYAASKMISEMMALWHGQQGFERVCVFRPHNVYGPDMGWEHVVPQFILRAVRLLAEQPAGDTLRFPIQGDGRQTRAFTHIDDCIDGIVLLMEKGAHRGLYHIGNPEELSIADVARAVVGHFGRRADIVAGEELPGATPRRCPDISRAAALGYAPAIPFAEGLPATADWYVANAGRAPAHAAA